MGLKLTITLCAICLWFATQAQDYVDLVKVNFNNTSNNKFENSAATTRIRKSMLKQHCHCASTQPPTLLLVSFTRTSIVD
ncbi:MAG: hypothetical protein WDO15_06540 [Bacteroidota bacterium]